MRSLKRRCAPLTTYFLRALLLISIGVVLAACSVTEDASEEDAVERVSVGQPLPTFSVTTTTGRTVTPDSLRGHVAVLCFFNTTCSDCRKTLPALQQLYEEMGEGAAASESERATMKKNKVLKESAAATTANESGVVEFLCISREQSAADVTTYWTQNAFTLPVSPQADRTVFNLFASRTIPRIYIADADGVVRSVFVEKTSYEEVREAIEAALETLSP